MSFASFEMSVLIYLKWPPGLVAIAISTARPNFSGDVNGQAGCGNKRQIVRAQRGEVR
jgi:hypothetical protein